MCEFFEVQNISRRSVCVPPTESASPSRLNTHGDAPPDTAVRNEARRRERSLARHWSGVRLPAPQTLPGHPCCCGITVWCRLARYCRAAGRISGAACCHRVRRDTPRPHQQLGHRVKELHADKGGLAAKRRWPSARCWWQRIHARAKPVYDRRGCDVRVLATNAIGPVLVSQALASRMNRGAIIGNLLPAWAPSRTTGWAAGGRTECRRRR